MPEDQRCILCDYSPVVIRPTGLTDSSIVNCSRCGRYEASGTLLAALPGEPGWGVANGYVLSALTRELNSSRNEVPKYDTSNIKDLIKRYPVPDLGNVEEKAMKLLERLKEKSTYFGETVSLDHRLDFPLAYAKNHEEFIALANLLKESGLVDVKSQNTANNIVALTAKGWGISHGKDNRGSEQAFVAVWFHDSMNDSIAAIESAITKSGFKPVCIRNEFFSERIMDKALGEMRKSRFVVVDLTGARGSVFFEAGFAFGLGTEAIYVFREGDDVKGSPLEFYVRHYQCYSYKDPADLAAKLADAIAARIKK